MPLLLCELLSNLFCFVGLVHHLALVPNQVTRTVDQHCKVATFADSWVHSSLHPPMDSQNPTCRNLQLIEQHSAQVC
jgi:hypothetical protein